MSSRNSPQKPDRKTGALLKSLITFDTSNPPGDTRALARFLATQFKMLGAEVEIVTAPNEKAAHFFARLRGDGSKKPILLAAHADVVPVERQVWTVAPFLGVEKDGFIYGRGALDFKGGLAVFARAVMMLAERKVPLARDVILLAEADEEQGAFNTTWLAKDHWDSMDAEFALNEGGYIFTDLDCKVRQVNITVADKLSVTLALTTTGPAGHSSRPFPVDDTATGRLIAALARLNAHNPRVKLVRAAETYFRALLPISSDKMAADIRALLDAEDEDAREAACRGLTDNTIRGGLLPNALLRDTMMVTVLESGSKPNVIPSEAKAMVNTRLLPGTRIEDIIQQIKTIIDDPRVEIRIVTPMSQEEAASHYLMRTQLPESPVNTPLYSALRRNAKCVWPESTIVPTMFEAGTDATAWRERNVPVYGVYPYPIDDDVLSRMHGPDEKIAMEALGQGTEWIYNTLLEVAAK